MTNPNYIKPTKNEELSTILDDNFYLNDVHGYIKELEKFTNGEEEDNNPFFSVHNITQYFEELKEQEIESDELKRLFVQHSQDIIELKRLSDLLACKIEKYQEDLAYFEKESGLDVKFTDLYS